MPINDMEQALYEAFTRLPREEVHPSTRAAVLDRISAYREQQQGVPALSTWLLRISGAVLAASLVVLVGITPLLIQNARSGDRIQEARMEVREEIYQTNQMRQYFQNSRPDYSSVHYVNY